MRPSYLTLFLVVGLLTWQSRGFAQTPPQPNVTTTAPAALALIDASIKTLSRPEGVDVQFKQTFTGFSEPATITGRSVTASNKRVHIDLKFKQVHRVAELKLLSDGVTFYRLTLTPNPSPGAPGEGSSDNNSMVTYSLQELQTVLDKLATSETERVVKEDLEKDHLGMHGFEGISAMINDLKRHMVFGEPVVSSIEVAGKPKQAVKVIEGRWNAETLDKIAPTKKTSDPNQQDQRYLWNEKMSGFMVPRLAKLYFDAVSGQLLRMELLGITEKQGPEKVLLNMDFLSITPLTTLDAKLFLPTEAELKYKQETINLAEAVKSQHQNLMNALKQQQLQK